jgi:DNA-binding CsgD family transcriptional regulator
MSEKNIETQCEKLKSSPLLPDLNDLNKRIGVCVKDNDDIILNLNEAATVLCRREVGEKCDGLGHCRLSGECVLDSKKKDALRSGRNPHAEFQSGSGDATHIQLGNLQVTFLLDVSSKIEVLGIEFKKWKLTESESRISFLRAKGISNKAIAKQLFISPATLKTHLHNIFQKLPSYLSDILRGK